MSGDDEITPSAAMKLFPARISKDDMLRLSQLRARWQVAQRANAQIPMTAIFRSVIAAALPILEQMDAPADEAELARRLEDLIKNQGPESA